MEATVGRLCSPSTRSFTRWSLMVTKGRASTWTMGLPSDRREGRGLSLALLVLLAASPLASAQDTHYWSIQYGPVGQLVGGQLIGGVDDLSSTFYNPGALALRKDESGYLLSTESFQREAVTTEARPGLDILDASTSHIGAAPSLLAGALPRWLGRDNHLAWSFLTRQKFDVRLGQRLTNPLAGPAVRSAAEAYFDQDADEEWAGLTLSRAVSDSVGLGLTWYGVYRGQRLRNELSFQAVTDNGGSTTANGVTDFKYSHYRTLAKVGLAWHTRVWKLGFSVTTPSLGVFGSGKAAYTLSLTGVDADQDGVVDAPTLATAHAEDLDSDYRSSWAVGAGASRSIGATRVYASAEWYAPVGRFAVINLPADAPNQQRLTQELGSVLNGGIGFEHALRHDVSLYGAFHTDYSASVGSARANVDVSDWDIYHLSGGVSFRIHDTRFTLGASWAKGSKTRALDIALPPDSLPGVDLGSAVEVRYSKLTFLLGFVFGH